MTKEPYSIIDKSFAQYMKDISGYRVLTKEEEKELSDIIRHSKSPQKRLEAINKLVEHSLKFVVTLAMPHQHQIANSANISMLDLISAGNIGLRKSAETFNADLGYKFSTYCSYMIKREIWAYIDDNIFTLRTPRNHREIIGKMLKIKFEKNCDMDIGELAKEVGKSEKRIKDILQVAANCNAISLETPTRESKDGDTSTLMDFLEDTDETRNSSSIIDNNNIREYFLSKLYELTPQEHTVVFLEFFSNEDMVLEDIGNELNLTRERIRQILAGALRKLRSWVTVELQEDTKSKNMYFRKLKRDNRLKTNGYCVVASYDELKDIANTITNNLINGDTCSLPELIRRAKKIKPHHFGWRISYVIRNDARLMAFISKPVYKALRNKNYDKSSLNFNNFDVEFAKSNRFKGYPWLEEHMYCVQDRLYRLSKRNGFLISSHIRFPEKEINVPRVQIKPLLENVDVRTIEGNPIK